MKNENLHFYKAILVQLIWCGLWVKMCDSSPRTLQVLAFEILTKSKIWFVFDENWAFVDPVTMQYEMGTLISHDSLAVLPSLIF